MKSRKTNRAKAVDPGCRNNGSCKVCEGNRLHSTEKQLQDDVEDLEDEQSPFERATSLYDDGEEEAMQSLREHEAKCAALGVCSYCEGTLKLFRFEAGVPPDGWKTVPCVCVRRGAL